MKDKLIELLDLNSDATEEQVVATVSKLKTESDEKKESNARERKIQDKIVESGHALTREQAIEVIEHQDGF